MTSRAVAVLRSPMVNDIQPHAPRRLFFEQNPDEDCCRVTIDIGDDLESVRDLEKGHVIVLEGGDLRDTHLCLTSKCLVEMPYRLEEVTLSAGIADDLLLITSIPRLDFSPGYPGSSGVIGRQCLLVNRGGRIVGEGLMGWAS